MRVVYHLGVHHTDGDRLVRSLLKNRDDLARQGIVVPGPGRYRRVLRDVVNRLRGEPASPEAREVLLDAIADIDRPKRLFLSNESFICLPERALDEGRLYARAFKTGWLRQIFPDDPVVFALGLRDPATFVPALFRARRARNLDVTGFLDGVDPRRLAWSDTVGLILETNPDARIVAWCNEDTPVAWPAIMAAVTGADPGTPFHGALDIARQIVDAEGRAALDDSFGPGPVADSRDGRRALAAILQAHGRDEEIEEVVDLPGWDARLMEDLSAAYDEDLRLISAMPRVTVVAP